MYSKAEMQQMKRDFWIEFADKYPRKWILYDTKIKDFALKFDADNKKAMVMIEVAMRDAVKRRAYFEKLESLRSILTEGYVPDAVFEEEFVQENGKITGRVYVELTGVGISNRGSWSRIHGFFNEKMSAFEEFFNDFQDYIQDV